MGTAHGSNNHAEIMTAAEAFSNEIGYAETDEILDDDDWFMINQFIDHYDACVKPRVAEIMQGVVEEPFMCRLETGPSGSQVSTTPVSTQKLSDLRTTRWGTD
ncbi:MAG: hypothetical protein J4432_04425 [DPANN group archaeon]|nr:hypothetical protein [DPANN group archaeon]